MTVAAETPPVPVHLRSLWDIIDPGHLLTRTDEKFDFGKLVAPPEDCCCPDNGRPAVHPEVMVGALPVSSRYNLSPFRRLGSAIARNIDCRWRCFLTIEVPVFDLSTISCFIERIGREGVTAVFQGLN